jgi:hypothetical protein
MPSALFEFFEIVADELSVEASRVITSEEVRVRGPGIAATRQAAG